MATEMLCKLIDDYPDATGIMPLLYAIRDCIPMAFSTLLFVIYFVLFAGNYFLMKNKTGRARILVSLFASSIVTLILGMFLLLGTLISYKLELFWTFLVIVLYIIIVFSDDS